MLVLSVLLLFIQDSFLFCLCQYLRYIGLGVSLLRLRAKRRTAELHIHVIPIGHCSTDILVDVTPPNFLNLLPLSEQFINVADISYTLTENLQEGKIVFTNVGGITDPNKEYSISLAGGKKNQGKQGGKLPVSVVSLNSGSIYSISFFGTDPAGNEAPQTIVENITFDNIKPVV